MSFTGNEGGTITLTDGSAWTTNYRNANSGATKAHFFGYVILNRILAQSGCVGIRMYYAIDANGAKQLVLVGVNASGTDLTSGIVADLSSPCPPYCDTTSLLYTSNPNG